MALPAFYPSSSHIAPAIIATFLEQQYRLPRLAAATHDLDLDRITITSPVLRFVTYSLMDAYRIIVVHEQNHFVQTTRVMESQGFRRHARCAAPSQARGPIDRQNPDAG